MHSLIEEIIANLEERNFEQAIINLYQLSKTYPENHLVFELLGNCYFQTNHYVEAIRNYDKAIDIISSVSTRDSKVLARLYNKRGIAFCKGNFYEEAIKDFWTAVELDPELSDAFKNLAFCFYKTDKIEDAIFYCSKAIDINPQNASAFLLKGNLHYYRNEGNEAIYNYSRAIEISPNYTEAYFNRGNAYLKFEKNSEKAKDDWETALKLDPSLKEDLEYKIELVLNHLESKNQSQKEASENVQTESSDIVIPDFDFKSLFEDESIKSSSEDVKPEVGSSLEEKFARGEEIIPAEVKQLHDEISNEPPKSKLANLKSETIKKRSPIGIWIVALIIILILTVASAVVYYVYFEQQAQHTIDTSSTKISAPLDTSSTEKTTANDTANQQSEENKDIISDTLNQSPFVVRIENRSDVVIIGENKAIYLQFGSYTRRDAAEKKLEEYSSKGLKVFIEEKTRDNTTFYRVRSGPYSSIEEAKTVVENLQ